MARLTVVVMFAMTLAIIAENATAELRGVYLETRTCQVYTGPCFANAEVGLAGKDAILAWRIDEGASSGVDLAGMHVVLVVNSQNTLGFRGLEGGGRMKSVILVDEKANPEQREALVAFATKQAGPAAKNVVRVDSVPVEMSLDLSELKGQVQAGKAVKIATRKARLGDCICSNESAYYPPLTKLKNFVPGVTIEGKFSGRGLGSRWSTPDARSSYLGTFTF